MTNLSILDRNIIHAMDDDDAELTFLRARDKLGSLRAEHLAYEWIFLRGVLKPIIEKVADDFEATTSENDVAEHVLSFIRERHYRIYAPGY